MKPTRANPVKLGISDINKSGGGEYDIVRSSKNLLGSPDNEISSFNRVAKPVIAAPVLNSLFKPPKDHC